MTPDSQRSVSFGGVTRGRISSQCLKRNIRLSEMFESTFGENTCQADEGSFQQLVGEELKDIKWLSR